MKKILIILTLMTLLLSACGSEAETPAEAAVPAPTLSAAFENAASIQAQLLIGIYQLENTTLAISKDQANILYPQLISLQTSMTNQMQPITEEEINALASQQAAVLSAEQIQAISDLQITQESIMATMQALGIERSNGTEGGEVAG